MSDYSLLDQINSSVLNSVFESKDFEEVENEKIIYQDRYSFREIYNKIVDLKEARSLYFWKDEENATLADYLNSFLIDFYIAKHIRKETEKIWMRSVKYINFLEYSFIHHFDFYFILMYQYKISDLFGSTKWDVMKSIETLEDYKEFLLDI